MRIAFLPLTALLLAACGNTSMPTDSKAPAAEPVPETATVVATTDASAGGGTVEVAQAAEPAAAEPEEPAEPEKAAGKVECYAGSSRVINQVYYGQPSMDSNSSRFRYKADSQNEIWTSLPCVYSDL